MAYGTGATECAGCDAGTFSPGMSMSCFNCSAGFFSSLRSAECSACVCMFACTHPRVRTHTYTHTPVGDEGKYSASKGSGQCTSCDAGEHQPSTSSIECVEWYMPTCTCARNALQLTRAMPCSSAGRYSPASGLAECIDWYVLWRDSDLFNAPRGQQPRVATKWRCLRVFEGKYLKQRG